MGWRAGRLPLRYDFYGRLALNLCGGSVIVPEALHPWGPSLIAMIGVFHQTPQRSRFARPAQARKWP